MKNTNDFKKSNPTNPTTPEIEGTTAGSTSKTEMPAKPQIVVEEKAVDS